MTPSLPTELLKAIFRYATEAGVDPSLAVTDAKSDWFAKFEEDNLGTMATKIALTRVSRRFRRISLEFLFEFVSIDKADQAVPLVALMKKQASTTAPGPREWIKFLCVRCSNTRLVIKIIRLCRSLRGFSWYPTTPSTRREIEEAAQDELINNIPVNIRYLHWNAVLNQASTFSVFLHKASASLQILSIRGIMRNPASGLPFSHLSFPSLTHFQVEDMYPFRWLDT
ncbi:hypothetical protein BD410DRAFT_525185 [Rickenella mellea]|uniref:F-box domain-containing protein n=1 Tax=Rickenella mellea TaxID=50990 RepID=A0A4Y7QI42_9AGAM|nr:hypothetical protein BD410DRAFT_525185 [Rickenella mellea]